MTISTLSPFIAGLQAPRRKVVAGAAALSFMITVTWRGSGPPIHRDHATEASSVLICPTRENGRQRELEEDQPDSGDQADGDHEQPERHRRQLAPELRAEQCTGR